MFWFYIYIQYLYICLKNLSSSHYSVNKNVRFKTHMLRSYLCDYSDANFAGKGAISVKYTNANNQRSLRITLRIKLRLHHAY